MKLTILDLCVLAVFFISQVLIGFYVGRKNSTTGQYFLAGKSFSGLIVGISFIGSIISSTTFIATPADSFKTAWFRFIPTFAFPFAVLLAAYFLIPFFRRGTITSAYHYLALRFGNSLSVYASIIFILMQVVRTSMIAYLLSLLVDEITGCGFTNALLMVVGVTAVYTVKGGIKAVIWTDVIQTVVLLVGGLACIVVVLVNIPGGLMTVFSDGIAHHKFSFWDMDTAVNQLVPTPWVGGFSEKTVLMLFLVGLMQYLNLVFDQSTVQRWCTAKTAHDARKSMYVLCVGSIPVWTAFQFLGTCLFVFFLYNPDPVAAEALSGVRKAEVIMPHFIMNYLPSGFVGMVIAGCFAAAMSTLSSSINVASMVGVNDLYKKYIRPQASDAGCLFLGKAFSVVVALVMVAGAIAIHTLDTLTLTDFILAISVIVTVGIPAVFIAGMFTRRVGTAAIWTGLGCALVLATWIVLSNAGKLPECIVWRVPSYYASVFGNVVAFAVAWGCSFFMKPTPRDMTNLTVWDQSKSQLE